MSDEHFTELKVEILHNRMDYLFIFRKKIKFKYCLPFMGSVKAVSKRDRGYPYKFKIKKNC